MKKMIIACAVVLAACLSSCGDTNYCYEVSVTTTVAGFSNTATSYVWGTSNELDAVIADTKASLEKSGISEDMYKIDYKRTKKSQSDCLPMQP